jgi:hypothetical protein
MSDSDLDAREVELAEVERRRLQAIVAADMAVADEPQASNFQLTTPDRTARSKSEYLTRIASGETHYQL